MQHKTRKRIWFWSLFLAAVVATYIFGIYPRKGSLVPGSEADFTVVDPDREWVLKAEDLFYRYKQSPYVGRSFKGAVTHTIVRGRTVFADGRIAGEPGYGRLVRRNS